MNIEFHYYAIFILALEAGFSEDQALILAASSQQIDSVYKPLKISTPRETITINPTQNYTFWSDDVRDYIYLPFHFLPGDPEVSSAARQDGARNPYAVSPNSELAKTLLIEALKSHNLYRIGIALHSFADTWAHQNFSGRNEEWNNLASNASGKDFAGLSLPPAGHLQALTWPDEPNRIWTDPRLRPELSSISNAERYRQAAGKIYRYLCINRGKQYADEDFLLDKLEKIWRSASRDERFADYVIEWRVADWKPAYWLHEAGLPENIQRLHSGYDKLAWLKDTIQDELGLGGTSQACRVDDSFYSSSLYQWHKAAELQRSRARELLLSKGLL
ncbi:MAG: hypothetical protein KKI09_10010 [Spirochaetes bacterium]|nr:hypothetical protein [Spirochaetota bacterium]MBU0955750.1 hypothetical protein [Spirochaetota bacterium]